LKKVYKAAKQRRLLFLVWEHFHFPRAVIQQTFHLLHILKRLIILFSAWSTGSEVQLQRSGRVGCREKPKQTSKTNSFVTLTMKNHSSVMLKTKSVPASGKGQDKYCTCWRTLSLCSADSQLKHGI